MVRQLQLDSAALPEELADVVVPGFLPVQLQEVLLFGYGLWVRGQTLLLFQLAYHQSLLGQLLLNLLDVVVLRRYSRTNARQLAQLSFNSILIIVLEMLSTPDQLVPPLQQPFVNFGQPLLINRSLGSLPGLLLLDA